MKIRKLQLKDLKSVAEIYAENFSKKPYNEKWNNKSALIHLKETFNHDKKHCFAAEENKKVVGAIFATLFTHSRGKYGFIESFIVDTDYQNKAPPEKLRGSLCFIPLNPYKERDAGPKLEK